MKQLLVTGFEPFGGFSENPSEEIARSLDGRRIGNFDTIGLVLPLDYNNGLQILDNVLEKNKPEIILCCGQANRASISIERIAVNLLNIKRPDNYGNIPETDVIVKDGPAAYFTNIDPYQLVQALLDDGIPAYVSYDAGAYGCNWLLYNVMHRIEHGVIDAKTTFIHLPPLPSQAIQNDMMTLATVPSKLQLKAMEIIIKSLS